MGSEDFGMAKIYIPAEGILFMHLSGLPKIDLTNILMASYGVIEVNLKKSAAVSEGTNRINNKKQVAG